MENTSNLLNPHQQQVVRTINGPVLVIAGPGSGKTRTLVERVVYLVQKGVDAANIMIATFTEKAAKELITRISSRLLEIGIRVNLNEMYIGTLHSIFLRILEEHREFTRLKRNYRLLDQFEQAFFVYRYFKRFEEIQEINELIGEKRLSRWRKAEQIIKKLNTVSEEVLNVEQLCTSEYAAVRALGRCYKLYTEILSEENALDFSTIQTETLQLIETYPGILQQIQDKIHYIMVDEYQDTNTVQEIILLRMAEKHKNICVVGDDDQGLYRFRGATIRNILEFGNNFAPEECHSFYLSMNYRSHPGIIDFYNRWMEVQDWSYENRSFRYEKNIFPAPKEFSHTASVIKLSSSVSEEAYFHEVLDFIHYLHDNQIITDYNQIAFLFRSVKNSNVTGLSQFLEENGLRIFSPRSDMFFQREEVKLILGALLSIFPTTEDILHEDSAIFPVYQEYKDYFINKIRENPSNNRSLIIWVTRMQKAHISLSRNTNYAFSALIYQMFQFPLFSHYLNVELNANKTDLRPAYNVGIITNLINKFEYLYNISVLTSKNLNPTLYGLFNEYLRFIYEGGLDEFENFDETIPAGCISFMTIHQSKGLEFPITIVGSMNGTPRKNYSDLDEILQTEYYHKPMFEPLEQIKFYDFRRLYYTAFSRAQNLLVLTGFEHTGASSTPSRYFRDFFIPLPSWRDTEHFDARKLQLETIKAVNIKHEYSFTSHILLYENCPLQYKFYKELEFAEVRTGAVLGGSLLHQTIEDIHKAILRREIHTLTDENITNWFNTNYQLLVKQHRSYLQEAQRNALLKQVLRYRDKNQHNWEQIKEAEVDISLMKDDYILKGTIDLIRGDKEGTVELVDFKSGDKPDVNTTDENKRKQLNQYRRQLEVYAHLIEQRTGEKVTRMHLYYPKEENGNPRITFEYKAPNVQNTIASFEEVVHKIENRDFSMQGCTMTEKKCSDCDMRYYCMTKLN